MPPWASKTIPEPTVPRDPPVSISTTDGTTVSATWRSWAWNWSRAPEPGMGDGEGAAPEPVSGAGGGVGALAALISAGVANRTGAVQAASRTGRPMDSSNAPGHHRLGVREFSRTNMRVTGGAWEKV